MAQPSAIQAGNGVMRGFSLVELMVAMAISLLLLAGVIAIFASSRASYETTDKMSRIQENGRYALDQLTYDIRSAGYVGCSRASTYVSTSLKDSTELLWDFRDGPVRGFNYASHETWTPTAPAGTPPADGSDILLLRMPVREAVPLRVQKDMTSGTDSIELPNVAGAFKSGDIALAYSCEAQAFFQVTGFSGGILEHAATGATPGNANDDISYAFRTNAEVVPVNTVVYYVDLNTAKTATSLYRKVGAGNAEELVEGVEQMEVDYGIDNDLDNAVDTYVTADNVTDWGRVFSVRVALLVRAMDQYGSDKDTRSYKLLTGDTAVTVPAPNDRRYREVFTSTVSLRNKVVIN